jgi:hypothetical protein
MTTGERSGAGEGIATGEGGTEFCGAGDLIG